MSDRARTLRHELTGDGNVRIITILAGEARPQTALVDRTTARRHAWALLADLDPDGAAQAAAADELDEAELARELEADRRAGEQAAERSRLRSLDRVVGESDQRLSVIRSLDGGARSAQDVAERRGLREMRALHLLERLASEGYVARVPSAWRKGSSQRYVLTSGGRAYLDSWEAAANG